MKIEVDYKAVIEIPDEEAEFIEVINDKMNDKFKNELKNEIDDIFISDFCFESSFYMGIVEDTILDHIERIDKN